MKKVVLFIALMCAATATVSQAQEGYIELLRSDVRAEKSAIITEVMQFTEAEASVFWPMQRDYEHELSKLSDARLELIKDFAAHYESMTDEKARDLAKRSFSLEEKRTKLKWKYYKKMSKEISPITVARFFQVERQLNSLIDLQLSQELPLISASGLE